MCCSSLCLRILLCTHYGFSQCFSTYFRKSKEIGVYGPYFYDILVTKDKEESSNQNKTYGR